MNPGMNLIKRYADDYFNNESCKLTDTELFISNIKRYCIRFDCPSDKIAFMEHILLLLKNNYERHVSYCTTNTTYSCRFVKAFDAISLYLQFELRKQESLLSVAEFKSYERKDLSRKLKEMVARMVPADVETKTDYKVLMDEMDELNEYYFLNKKIWHQLLSGKLIDLLGHHIIKEGAYHQIMHSVNHLHPEPVLAGV